MFSRVYKGLPHRLAGGRCRPQTARPRAASPEQNSATWRSSGLPSGAVSARYPHSAVAFICSRQPHATEVSGSIQFRRKATPAGPAPRRRLHLFMRALSHSGAEQRHVAQQRAAVGARLRQVPALRRRLHLSVGQPQAAVVSTDSPPLKKATPTGPALRRRLHLAVTIPGRGGVSQRLFPLLAKATPQVHVTRI